MTEPGCELGARCLQTLTLGLTVQRCRDLNYQDKSVLGELLMEGRRTEGEVWKLEVLSVLSSPIPSTRPRPDPRSCPVPPPSGYPHGGGRRFWPWASRPHTAPITPPTPIQPARCTGLQGPPGLNGGSDAVTRILRRQHLSIPTAPQITEDSKQLPSRISSRSMSIYRNTKQNRNLETHLLVASLE